MSLFDNILNAITGKPTQSQIDNITQQSQLDQLRAMGIYNPDGTFNPNAQIGGISIAELYSMGYSTSDIQTIAEQQAAADAGVLYTGQTADQSIAQNGIVGSIFASPGGQNLGGSGLSLKGLLAGSAGLVLLILAVVIFLEFRR